MRSSHINVGQSEKENRLIYVIRKCSGGMLGHLLGLLDSLDGSGWSALVAGPPYPSLQEAVSERGVPYVGIPVGENRLLNHQRAVWELSELIHRQRAVLLHTHGVWAGLLGRPAAKRVGIPVVVTAHNFVYSRPGPAWKKAALAWRQRRLVPDTARFIAVCEGLANELQRVEGVPESRITTIYNGIDLHRLERLFAGSGTGIDFQNHRVPTVGTIARFIPEKGVDLFLRAASVVAREKPLTRFLIIGEGPDRAKLTALTSRLGLEGRVDFRTAAPAAGHLPRLTVYVQPSRQEGLSLAVLEAMAASLPVVAARTGGLIEEVQSGRTGLFFEPGNWRELAQRIIALLNDPEGSSRMGRRGRRRVEERFNLEGMVSSTLKVYQDLKEGREPDTNACHAGD